MTNTDVFAIDVSRLTPEQVEPGIRVHRLWRSSQAPSAARALVLDFAPGAVWPTVDVHEPGPEEVYIVSGQFEGLTTPDSHHGPGTFLHFEVGTSHQPGSSTGGRIFVFYPRG